MFHMLVFVIGGLILLVYSIISIFAVGSFFVFYTYHQNHPLLFWLWVGLIGFLLYVYARLKGV